MSELDDDPELGEPVRELERLAEEPRLGFLDRVRHAIERRRLGSQVAGLWWHGLALVVLEFIAILAGLLGGGSEPPGDGESDRGST